MTEQSNNDIALAIETSGRYGSAALGAGTRILGSKSLSAAMRHSAELFMAATSLLEEHKKQPRDIHNVYLTIGPGSFTGLRIAVTMAKMISLANDARITTVSTLDVLAHNATDHIRSHALDFDKVAVVLDAKRGLHFCAVYAPNKGTLERVSPETICTAEEFKDKFVNPGETIALLGEGLVFYADRFSADNICVLPESTWYPDARKLYALAHAKAEMGVFTAPEALVPTYLRDPGALEKTQRQLR